MVGRGRRARRIGEDRPDPLDGLGAGQREGRVLGHVDGDPQRGLRAALADPDLEHPEAGVLDRELDIAQVRVVAFQPGRVIAQLCRHVRQPRIKDADRLGLVRARDDVLALGIEHDVAVQVGLAGRRVAREQDAGARIRAAVAEDHRLDRDRGPEIVRDPLAPPVCPGAVAVPGREHGLDRAAQLEPRVVRDSVDADDRAIARVEPLAAVPGELGVTRGAREPGRRRIGESEVEDRVHHPGHRDGRAGPDADEERIRGIAEAAPDDGFDRRHPVAQFRVESRRPAVGQEGPAGHGRDREAGRDRAARGRP